MKMDELENDLDHLFSQARTDRDKLPDDLAVRILTDAEAVRLSRIKPAPARAVWQQVMSAMGGWPGVSGLATASLAGIWIGLSAPSFLPDPANLLYPQDTTFLAADLGFDTSYLEDTE